MDYNNYIRNKARGSVTLSKIGATKVFATSKRWDPETGDELPAVTEELNEDRVNQLIANAEKQIASATSDKKNYSQLLTDMKAVEVVEKY